MTGLLGIEAEEEGDNWCALLRLSQRTNDGDAVGVGGVSAIKLMSKVLAVMAAT